MEKHVCKILLILKKFLSIGINNNQQIIYCLRIIRLLLNVVLFLCYTSDIGVNYFYLIR